MKYRIMNLMLIITAAVTLNFIFWPGPHGGPQFLHEILWGSPTSHLPLIIQCILVLLLVLGAICALVSHRLIRLTGTWVSIAGLLTLFMLLLTGIYPPVIPVVLLSALPFLAALVGSVFLAFRPRKEKKMTTNKGVQAFGDKSPQPDP